MTRKIRRRNRRPGSFAYRTAGYIPDGVLRYLHSDRTKNLVVFAAREKKRGSQIFRAPANFDELENLILATAIRSSDLCRFFASDANGRRTISTALPDICAVPALRVWLRFAVEDFAKLLSRVELAVRLFVWEKCVCDACAPDDDDLFADHTRTGDARLLHRNIGMWNSASFALVVAWVFDRLAKQRSDAFERESTRLAELFDLCLGTGNVLLALPFGCAVSRNRIEPSIRAFLKSHSNKPNLDENSSRILYYAADERGACNSDGSNFCDVDIYSDDSDYEESVRVVQYRDRCYHCLPSVSSDWIFLATKLLTLVRDTHVTPDNFSPFHHMWGRVGELRLLCESMCDRSTLEGKSARVVSRVHGIPGVVRMPRPWRLATLRYFRRVNAVLPVRLLSEETFIGRRVETR